jgi:hypothetical protein
MVWALGCIMVWWQLHSSPKSTEIFITQITISVFQRSSHFLSPLLVLHQSSRSLLVFVLVNRPACSTLYLFFSFSSCGWHTSRSVYFSSFLMKSTTFWISFSNLGCMAVDRLPTLGVLLEVLSFLFSPTMGLSWAWLVGDLVPALLAIVVCFVPSPTVTLGTCFPCWLFLRGRLGFFFGGGDRIVSGRASWGLASERGGAAV